MMELTKGLSIPLSKCLRERVNFSSEMKKKKKRDESKWAAWLCQLYLLAVSGESLILGMFHYSFLRN